MMNFLKSSSRVSRFGFLGAAILIGLPGCGGGQQSGGQATPTAESQAALKNSEEAFRQSQQAGAQAPQPNK